MTGFDSIKKAKGLTFGQDGVSREDVETVMHMDGCHFFVWVVREPSGRVVLTFDERAPGDLALHGRFSKETWKDETQTSHVDGPCERCLALRSGALRRHESRVLDDLAVDSRDCVVQVFTAVAEIEQAA